MLFDRGVTSRGHTLPKFMGKSRFSESATKFDVYLVHKLKYGFYNKSFRKDEPLTHPKVRTNVLKSVQLLRVSFFRSDILSKLVL